jgi:glycosyltransferase involved in cell wall biosynthesis
MGAGVPIRANIVSWDGGGLGTDIDILAGALARLGCAVAYKGHPVRHPRSLVTSKLLTAGVWGMRQVAARTGWRPFDVTFFLETVFPEYLPLARRNVLVPNPEWFRDENLPLVPRLDALLCKTPSAERFLAGLGAPVQPLGFTSHDRGDGTLAAARTPVRCLHIAGASLLKGTAAVHAAWLRHPEWPPLTIVRRARDYGGGEQLPLAEAPNVRVEGGHLAPEALVALQRASAVHLIPSEAEGYGHIIGEGMSCGAVVVTTDAPPMNELAGPDRAVLVPVARTEAMRRGFRHQVDISALEAQLSPVFAMTVDERAALGARARGWFEAQDRRFQERLQMVLMDGTT